LNYCVITLLGAFRAKKKKIPAEMREKYTRAYGSNACLYTKEMAKKLVLLLSSQHTQPDRAASGKPEII